MADTGEPTPPDSSGAADDRRPAVGPHGDAAGERDRTGEMQRRLDELGEGIDAARRRAEADDLLPEGGDAAADGPPIAPGAFPRGDQAVETPVDEAEFESGG